MSRTFRHRHAAPPGWVVRDDGVPYFPDCCSNKKAQRKSWRPFYYSDCCICHPSWQGIPWFPNIYRREKKSNRKPHYRQYKAKMKHLLRTGRYEDIRPYRRTGGWLTW